MKLLIVKLGRGCSRIATVSDLVCSQPIHLVAWVGRLNLVSGSRNCNRWNRHDCFDTDSKLMTSRLMAIM